MIVRLYPADFRDADYLWFVQIRLGRAVLGVRQTFGCGYAKAHVTGFFCTRAAFEYRITAERVSRTGLPA